MTPWLRYPILAICKPVVWVVFRPTLFALVYVPCAVLTMIEAAWNNESIREVWRRQTKGLRTP